MVIDGKEIAEYILREIRETVLLRHNSFLMESVNNVENKNIFFTKSAPRLVAVTCAPNFETRKYLEMKKAKAVSVGVDLAVVELSAKVTTTEVVDVVQRVVSESDGVVVQLPFPSTIDRETILSAVPPEKDPDGFSYGTNAGACLPPVVGAIDEISKKYQVSWQGRRVLVLGEGRLVGRPASIYARERGAEVVVLTEATYDPSLLQSADIVITGIGKPHLITPDLIRDGVIIFDAGTSEANGVLAGDVHPDGASKASLLTPVPNGIGPITIAYLLKNLVTLHVQQSIV
jgi:methylenetetrahydrofolate dehydrogenase (NADP+) / methenyltetrahydrofolate cyclohydrolase